MSAEKAHQRKWFKFSRVMGPLLILMMTITAGIFVVTRPQTETRAANDAVNPNCTLIVPDNALSAQGLATPYQLVATNRRNGACHERNAAQAAFVQGAIFDPATNQISIYDPLVVDRGAQPAADPVVPTLPQGAIVALWFGYNGGNLTLRGAADTTLGNAHCVNGVGGSIFGQVAYCNAPAFFSAAQQAIQAGKLQVPQLGTGQDGKTCPTVRDFSVVDMDQSDNVTTTYLISADGRTAQMSAANVAKLAGAQTLVNGSDNRLVSVAVDGALGCKPWTAPNLADPGQMEPAQPLNELLAANRQADPMALVPAGDPMVLMNGRQSLEKVNAYRQGVDQPAVQNLDMAATKAYCTNLRAVAPDRILLDAPLTQGRPSVDPAVASNLFTFLAQRFNTTYGANGLNCQDLLGQKSPIKLLQQGNVTVGAVINGTQVGNNGDNGGNNGNNDNGGNNQDQQQGDHGQNMKKPAAMKDQNGKAGQNQQVNAGQQQTAKDQQANAGQQKTAKDRSKNKGQQHH